MEWRSAEGRFERVSDIVRELVSIDVDVIVTVTTVMTRAARAGGRAMVASWWRTVAAWFSDVVFTSPSP